MCQLHLNWVNGPLPTAQEPILRNLSPAPTHPAPNPAHHVLEAIMLGDIPKVCFSGVLISLGLTCPRQMSEHNNGDALWFAPRFSLLYPTDRTHQSGNLRLSRTSDVSNPGTSVIFTEAASICCSPPVLRWARDS